RPVKRAGDWHEQRAARPEQQRLGEGPRLARLVQGDLLQQRPGRGVEDQDLVVVTGVGPEAGDVQVAVRGAQGALGQVQVLQLAGVVRVVVGGDDGVRPAGRVEAQDVADLEVVYALGRDVELAVRAEHQAARVELAEGLGGREAAQELA